MKKVEKIFSFNFSKNVKNQIVLRKEAFQSKKYFKWFKKSIFQSEFFFWNLSTLFIQNFRTFSTIFGRIFLNEKDWLLLFTFFKKFKNEKGYIQIGCFSVKQSLFIKRKNPYEEFFTSPFFQKENFLVSF